MVNKCKKSPVKKTPRKAKSLADYIFDKSKYRKHNPDKIPDSAEHHFHKMTPLPDGRSRGDIYVGNCDTAEDRKFFKKHNIKAVLNCTRVDEANHFECDPNIEYLRIDVDDQLRASDMKRMYKMLPLAVEFIYKHADILKNNILVHCSMGAERSITCFVGYLMKYHNMTPKKACHFAMHRRPTAFFYGHSLNFEEPIEKYYKDLAKK